MIEQAGTAVLEAPELNSRQQPVIHQDASFDPFDMFDVEPTDSRLEASEFGSA